MLDYAKCFPYNGKGDRRKNEDIGDYLQSEHINLFQFDRLSKKLQHPKN